MKSNRVKRIPYGVSDYEKIAEGDYYFVDKTSYLPVIEKAGDYLFFIRPRRFGKSLFLSMLKCYYDVLYNDQFEKLFKGTWVYDNPTGERGQYLVLSLNFSSVDPSMDRLERSFLEMIRKRALVFVEQYAGYIGKQRDYFSKEIETAGSPSDILTAVLSLCQLAGQKIYVIIDEYDNFANTILTASGDGAYHALTHEDGFLRSFFNILKSGTTDAGAPVSRLFITGVSPVTMDDVTSGFNIGENISLDLAINRMLGFTHDDVAGLVEYYRRAGKIAHPTGQLMKLMKQWYGNYLFSGDDSTPLFNSDMVLYFLKNYMKQQKMPDTLMDRNVRIDYGKLRHLLIIDRDKERLPTTNGNFSKLKQIIEKGETLSKISDGFPLEKMTETNNFKSLLFYFGLLTIKCRERNRYRLTIPNETIKRLYFDYIDEAYRETGVFSLDLDRYAGLMSDMAYDGAWRPL
ncbi:MAG: AAA family ATPase, partial [bacterium]|nr:AAA family ATPase [bacterium]